MLDKGIHKYQNRAIEAAQVIEKLIKLAKEMLGAYKRGENLGMSDDEIAFYDALEVSDSAVKVLGDETLKTIARELVKDVLIVVTLYPFICKAKTSGFKLAEHAEAAWFPPDKPARLNGAKRPAMLDSTWACRPGLGRG